MADLRGTTGRRRAGTWPALLVALALACGGGETTPPEATIRASAGVAEALGGGAEGFARAVEPRVFRFPADHGPHPAFRTEWWYFTGNLESSAGRRFGFQLTFFRNRLTPEAPPRGSAWAADTVYMAHFALTDVAGGRFYAFERFARAAAGLAGAEGEPFKVWVEDWQAAAPAPGDAGRGEGIPPLRLAAAAEGVALDLLLAPGKAAVLQGDEGLSRKSAEPGNASYYYSLTRLPASGTVTAGGEAHAVAGLAWMDREWSTSALGADQVGWDWFALQLDDGSELMFYRLRRRDGSADPLSSGSLVDARGERHALALGDVELAELDRWQSPASGTVYPAGWRLAVPDEDLELLVEPLLADQELDLTFRYWEGAVSVRGSDGGKPVAGRGYVELTGYD